MTARRAMTKARRDRIALNHFIRIYGPLKCAICGKTLDARSKWTPEHMNPFALGGADDDGEDNVRPAHPECAAMKTNGTAATGHRGDISAIARAVRLASGGKNRAPGPKGRSTIPTRTAKLPSRPFQKTHRPLRGKRTKETTI